MQRHRPRLIVASSVMTTLLFGACTPTPPVTFRDTGRLDAATSGNPDTGRPGIDAATPPDPDAGRDAATEPDAGPDDMTPTMPYEGPVEGVATGVVTDARSGDAIMGARISVTGSIVEATTGVDGAYSLGIAPGDYVIHFSRDGYVATHRRLHVDGWERVAINATLLPSGPSTAVDNGTGATLTVGGTRVTIPAGSITDSTGTAVGTGMVTITPIDPTMGLEGAPGDFEGVPMTGMPGPIVSFGMVDIDVQTPSGPGDLATGTTATIEVPVGTMPMDNPPLAEGECMPLWWFDPDRGIWVEEGEACAMRSPTGGGLVLVGNVGRPGVWNCDVPVQPVCYTGTVTDCGGMPIPGAEIRLTGASITSTTTTRTDIDGHFEVRGAARRGAIVQATVVVAGNTYIEQTDFINGNPATCTPAPTLAFPFRYVSGTVTGTGLEIHAFRGSERVSTSRSGGARFWDVARGPVPYTLTCNPAPTNAFESPPADLMPTPSSIDVGNPVTLTAGGMTTDLFRTRVSSSITGYATTFDRTLPLASAFDVDIRGAAGAMPRTRLPGALHMPSPTFAVSSPASGVARSYPATAIPLRWTTAADGAEVTVMIFSATDTSRVAYARLVDDGEETISLAGFPTIRGAVSIWITRSVTRYERLPIGSAVRLSGSQRFTFDATIL